MSSLATEPAGTAVRGRRRWLALPVILVGTFMTILDFFIVNVAIPSAQAELRATDAQIQFVVAGYGMAYASGLITGGRLGDLYGRRRVFAIGLAGFTVASALCGLATGPVMLLAARVLQGVAAALMFPQVLSVITVTYTGDDRPRAFAGYGAALGLATVGGQVLGGLLIAADVLGLGWRACFLVNLPVGVVTLLLLRLVPESRSETARTLDLTGVVLVVPALLLLLVPLVEGRQEGWPGWTFASLAASAAMFALFAVQQVRLSRAGGAPLVEPSLFRSRSFTAGLATVLAVYGGMASFMLVIALYVQDGLGRSPLGAGLVFLPMGVAFFATSANAARFTRLLGRRTLTAGALLVVAGEGCLALVTRNAGAEVDLPLYEALMAVAGAGIGMVGAPLLSQALSGVGPGDAGSASGVLSTVQQMAGALGVALIGIVFFGVLGGAGGDAASPQAYGRAFAASLVCLGALAAAAAVLTVPDRWWGGPASSAGHVGSR
ncbi:MFS transporter [Microbispora sitophila]|uniref:MFS transporter n=1 Tax=Microbispora sitophila TaxID=2771537 RepID=UPI001D017032|nr:MFS transporter [Microbispora sitophila]